MASIVEKEINGSGPYLYHVETNDYDQDWEYLARADEIDLEPGRTGLSKEEAQELVDTDGDGDIDAIEFHDRESANIARDLVPDELLVDGGDRRKTTVKLRREASEARQMMVTGMAADSRSHLADKYGQAPLTEKEKQKLDFTKDGTDPFTARSAKAIMKGEGVNDWLTYWSEDLTVDETRGKALEAKRDEVGERMDTGETEEDHEQKYADAYNRARRDREDHAEQGCRDGHGEACDELRDLGWSEEEIDALQSSTGSAEEFARAMQDERKMQGVSPAAAD